MVFLFFIFCFFLFFVFVLFLFLFFLASQAMDTEFDFGEGSASTGSVPRSVAEMASVVEEVLAEADVSAKRPSQLDIPEFVRYALL